MGNWFYSCWQKIQKTGPWGEYGHPLPNFQLQLPYLFTTSDFIPAWFKLFKLCIIWVLQLRNQRGHTLRCSHYVPSPFPEDTPLPCVIYCHGNRFSQSPWMFHFQKIYCLTAFWVRICSSKSCICNYEIAIACSSLFLVWHDKFLSPTSGRIRKLIAKCFTDD